MKCKLLGNLDNKKCEYALAGLSTVYLANYYRPIMGKESVSDAIAYEMNDQEIVTAIHLPKGEDFYKIDFEDGTGSWTDDLAQGGNGGKYRTHTLNLVNAQYDEEMLKHVDALSLGRFIAIVVDKSGKQMILGRTSGLTATSWNYASGAADADANGWTGVLSGASSEIAPLYKEIILPTIQEAWVDTGYFKWTNSTKTGLEITDLGRQQEYLPDVKDGEQLTSALDMFKEGKLKEAPMFDTSNITNFKGVFYNCSFLTSIPELDTSRGIDFHAVFGGCSLLTSIPEINTSRGINFNGMFGRCSSLVSIPCLDTSQGTQLQSMFSECSSLISIPNLDTSRGIQFQYMFYKCSSLQKKPNLDISKATNKDGMYTGTKFA